MARLEWHSPESRVIEAGVDRGVIYPHNGRGVAWTGLISVSEKRSKGNLLPLYYEGEKFNILSSNSERTSTVSAFTYPDVLDQLTGLHSDRYGIQYDDQEAEFFSMTYRTMVGLQGDYKIHVLFNQKAEINDANRNTMTNVPVQVEFSWDLQGVPIRLMGKRTTSITLDSRELDPQLLRTLEEKLYGTPERDSSFVEFLEYIG